MRLCLETERFIFHSEITLNKMIKQPGSISSMLVQSDRDDPKAGQSLNRSRKDSTSLPGLEEVLKRK